MGPVRINVISQLQASSQYGMEPTREDKYTNIYVYA